MTWRGSTTVPERIFACLPYLLPLIDGLQFGQFLFRQFPVLGLFFVPIVPVLKIYQTVPFAGLIIFFGLYLGVVRNENINHFIRFNAMQAILIDIILVLCSLILGLFAGGQVSFVIQTLFNMVFLGLVSAFVYAVVQSLLGRYAEIPALSDAVYMQVR